MCSKQIHYSCLPIDTWLNISFYLNGMQPGYHRLQSHPVIAIHVHYAAFLYNGFSLTRYMTIILFTSTKVFKCKITKTYKQGSWWQKVSMMGQTNMLHKWVHEYWPCMAHVAKKRKDNRHVPETLPKQKKKWQCVGYIMCTYSDWPVHHTVLKNAQTTYTTHTHKTWKATTKCIWISIHRKQRNMW